ncbi:MAG: hypothetical protein ABEJ58_03815 [Halodesulfurarchaeum sp.]
MNDQVLGAGVVIVTLLFLRFGGPVADLICNTIDPPPDIVDRRPP